MTEEWFPYPTLWNSNSALGYSSTMFSNLFPLFWMQGLLSKAGIGFSASERIIWFFPFLVLVWLSSLFLCRVLRLSWPASAVGSVLYAINPYVLVLTANSGHLNLALAYSLSPAVIGCVIKACRGLSPWWAVASALTLTLEFGCDIRIGYLTFLVAVVTVLLYLVRSFWSDRSTVIKWLRLLAIWVITLPILNLFWILPGIASLGFEDVQLREQPFFPFTRLTHAMTLVQPYWTGGPIKYFVRAPVNLWGFALLLLAFFCLTLSWRSIKGIAAAALVICGALIAKQQNPPFGELFLAAYKNVPTLNLFGDATKFFAWIALGFMILLSSSLDRINLLPSLSLRRITLTVTGTVTATIVAAFMLPAVTQELGGTLEPRNFSVSHKALNKWLSESEPGRVLWVPWTTSPVPETPSHPAVRAAGNKILMKNCSELLACLSNSASLRSFLRRASIRYVAVRQSPTIKEVNQGAARFPRDEYIEALNKLDAAEPSFGNLNLGLATSQVALYEYKNPLPRIFLSAAAGDPELSDEAQVKVTSHRGGFNVQIPPLQEDSWLVMSQTFDRRWLGRALNSDRPLRHKKLNDFANGFLIPASLSPSKIKLDFQPQGPADLATVVSLGTFLSMASWLLVTRKRSKEDAVAQVQHFELREWGGVLSTLANRSAFGLLIFSGLVALSQTMRFLKPIETLVANLGSKDVWAASDRLMGVAIFMFLATSITSLLSWAFRRPQNENENP